jgi:predicted DNA-binding transcriptional regulator AlpA
VSAAAYLTTGEASRLTGLSPAWFERSRWAGGGPPFVKLGAAVRYPVDELHAWMRARIRTSTTDGAGACTSAPSHVGG